MLSIVVPIHNVAPYLERCLASILAQPQDDFEVVLVDDGSTDGSHEIAASAAAAHRHVRLITQANAGLGAARNVGVAASRGCFVTFVDSDDFLPADAYTAMLRTLQETGSDFAVGKLKRVDRGRRFATPRMRENHRVDRHRVTLDEMPQILSDVFAVNKVFRRSFWSGADLAFPEGVHYEDQPTLTAAFLRSSSFDVLAQTVYLWRIRVDHSSITQQRHEVADLRDRIATKRTARALLDAASPHVRTTWLADVLPVDMWEYFKAVPSCTDEYWHLLRDAVRDFWGHDSVPFEHVLIPVQQRLMGWLVGQDRRADLEHLLTFIEAHPGGLPLAEHDGVELCLLPGFEEAGVTVPLELYRLGPREDPKRFVRCVMPARERAPATHHGRVPAWITTPPTMGVGRASLSTA